MKKLLMSAAFAVMALSQTAHAGLLITGTPTVHTGVPTGISPLNDFRTVFKNSSGDLRFNEWANFGGLTATKNEKITFYALGSEAKFLDHFNIDGTTVYSTINGSHKYREGYAAWTSATAGSQALDLSATSAHPLLNIGTIKATAGENLFNRFNFWSSQASGADGHLSTAGFGVFYNNALGGATADHATFGFGYDDQTKPKIDGNHDDLFIVAVTSTVPEASTWMMMLLGFGVAGYGLRSRNRLMQTA